MVEPVGFVDAWRAQFPESDPPCMELNSMGEIEQELDKCKSSIKHLEKEVNKERFRMIYLQTLLAKEKKSYDGQRWGFKPVVQNDNGVDSGQDKKINKPTRCKSHPHSDLAKSRVSPVTQDSTEVPDIPTGPGSVAAIRSTFERIRRLGSNYQLSNCRISNIIIQVMFSFVSLSFSIVCLSSTEAPYNDTSGSYTFDLDQSEDQTQDSFSGSPPQSPRLCSKSRSSRDTQSNDSLESALSVSTFHIKLLDQEKGLEMRKWVLSGILSSEETYLSHLEALLIPMKPLRAAATTSQPMLTVQQIETIFFKVPELYEIHKEFYDALLPRVQDWSQNQCVGDLFQKLASQLGVYRAFVDNYKVAVETADKCCQANAQFAQISESLKVKSTKDCKDQSAKYSLETLLYKPIDRVTRSTLVLHDLLKHTPSSHPDLPLLQDALRISQNFLSSVNEEITPRRQSMTIKKGEHRQLLRDRFMVELVEGSRKLRHVFLFTDLLLCTKLKKQSLGKGQQYDCKWYIPLADLTFQTLEDCESTPIPLVQDEEIDAMKIKISQIKNDIQREKRTTKAPKVIERLRKKLSEQESMLLLMSPNMAFRVASRNGKGFTFLISSDYERAEWREIIREQQKKCSFSLTSLELQMLTNSCVKLQTVHTIPMTMSKEDDESSGLYGFLNVIVHSASGLKQSLGKYYSSVSTIMYSFAKLYSEGY
uniref:Uncharacterized protein n=1 Tax=Periophthalmus magnuspinnatus TaxID=409849 RepID=A0A3B3ZIP7_9GOBI